MDKPLTKTPGKAPLELVEEEEPPAVESLAAAREGLLPLEDVVESPVEALVEALADETAEVLAAEAMGDVEEAAAGVWISEVIAELALTSPDSVVSVEDEIEKLWNNICKTIVNVCNSRLGSILRSTDGSDTRSLYDGN